MTRRGALIGGAVGTTFFYVTNPNKKLGVDFFNVLGWIIAAPQFAGIGALVGYFVL